MARRGAHLSPVPTPIAAASPEEPDEVESKILHLPMAYGGYEQNSNGEGSFRYLRCAYAHMHRRAHARACAHVWDGRGDCARAAPACAPAVDARARICAATQEHWRDDAVREQGDGRHVP